MILNNLVDLGSVDLVVAIDVLVAHGLLDCIQLSITIQVVHGADLGEMIVLVLAVLLVVLLLEYITFVDGASLARIIQHAELY